MLIPAGTELLLLGLYDTEVNVYEIGLSKMANLSHGLDFQKLESLNACLKAVKDWFDLYFTISPALYIGFSQQTYSQLAHCSIALYRLSTFEDRDWDRRLVQKTLDFSLVLGHIAEKFSEVKLAAKLDCDSSEDKDVYTGLSRKFASFKAWYDSREAVDSMNAEVPGTDEAMHEPSANLMDDAWLNDILSFGEYLFEPYLQ